MQHHARRHPLMADDNIPPTGARDGTEHRTIGVYGIYRVRQWANSDEQQLAPGGNTWAILQTIMSTAHMLVDAEIAAARSPASGEVARTPRAETTRLPRHVARDVRTHRDCTETRCTHAAATDCSICLSVYEPADVLITLPCSHQFHATCLLTWLVDKNTCPCCRYELDTVDAKYNETLTRRTDPSQDASCADPHRLTLPTLPICKEFEASRKNSR